MPVLQRARTNVWEGWKASQGVASIQIRTWAITFVVWRDVRLRKYWSMYSYNQTTARWWSVCIHSIQTARVFGQENNFADIIHCQIHTFFPILFRTSVRRERPRLLHLGIRQLTHACKGSGRVWCRYSSQNCQARHGGRTGKRERCQVWVDRWRRKRNANEKAD